MQIEYRKVGELKPYPGNPRKISDEMLEMLRTSIREFGLVDPLVINKNNQVVGGNQRLRAAIEEGFEEVPVVIVDLPKGKEKALNIALNKIQGEWDVEKLKEFLEDLDEDGSLMEITGFSNDEVTELFEAVEEEQENYTRKIEPPIYEITGDKPSLGDMYNDGKYQKFLKRIAELNVDDDVKLFLMSTATRFIEFRYDKIAEFYAHSDKDVQEVMQELALVIIDFDKAIELGFVKMSEDAMEEYGVERG